MRPSLRNLPTRYTRQPRTRPRGANVVTFRRGGGMVSAPQNLSSPIDQIVTSVRNVLWLTPQAAVTGTHFAWEDYSAYENHHTASGDERPTILPAWLDGNPAVVFDGVQQQLSRSVFRGFGIGSKPCVIIVGAADADCPVVSGTVFSARGGSQVLPCTTLLEWKRTGIAQTDSFLGAGATHSRAQGAAVADSTPHWLMSVSANASNLAETYVDGVLVATGGAGEAGGLFETSTHSYIGGSRGNIFNDPANRWFKGPLAEIFAFDGVPTSEEFDVLFEQILAPRWPSLSWGFA